MKSFACVAALALGLSAGAAFATDVGVSVQISQPGVYGRIDIGRFPQPAVVLPQPVVVAPAPVAAPPVYLWVPPGHRKQWSRHCGRYNACGVPVYFVQEGWYRQHVMPPPGRGGDHGHGRGRDHDHDHDRGRQHRD